MNLGVLPFLLASFALVILGGQDLLMALIHRKQVEVSISDYIQKQPDAKWLKITGAQLDTINAMYFSPRIVKMDAQDVYVPVKVAGNDTRNQPIHIILHTSSPELLKLVNEAKSLSDGKKIETTQKAMELIQQNMEASLLTRDVEGLVQYGISSNDKRNFQIKKHIPQVTKDFIVLEDGGRPSVLKGLLMMVPGLLIGGVALRGLLKKGDTGKLPPPLPGTPPPLQG